MKKVKIVLSIFVIICVIILFLPQTVLVFYGWVNITDKKVSEDKYHLQINFDDNDAEIIMNKSKEFIYKEENYTEEEILMNEIWNQIDLNNNYFMRIEKKGIFGSTYEITEFYEE